MRYLGMPEERREQLQKKQIRGYQALDLMENHLVNNSYLVGNQCTIADISLYAYTHVADEGGFDLSGYSEILNWLDKIQSLDGYVGMDGWDTRRIKIVIEINNVYTAYLRNQIPEDYLIKMSTRDQL